MKLLIIALAASLTACATPPSWLANHYDRADICSTRELAQDGTRLKPQGYQQPNACAGSGTRLVTREYSTNRPLTTTRIER
jgi:starvation-inducible outer membrane lipoprotein